MAGPTNLLPVSPWVAAGEAVKQARMLAEEKARQARLDALQQAKFEQEQQQASVENALRSRQIGVLEKNQALEQASAAQKISNLAAMSVAQNSLLHGNGFVQPGLEARAMPGQGQALTNLGRISMAPNEMKAQGPAATGAAMEPWQRTALEAQLAGFDAPMSGFKPDTPPKPDRQTLHGVLGPNGRPVTRILEDGKPAQDIPEYVAPKTDGADRLQYTTMAGPDGKDVAVVVNLSTGKATPVEAGGLSPRQPAKPISGMERQTLAFYNRAIEADTVAAPLEDQLAHMGPIGQAQAGLMPRLLQGEVGKSYTDAQKMFTEARLRKESGAAVPQSEYDNDARTYFWQPGDSPARVAQKRQGRLQVLRGLRSTAGDRAFDEFYGQTTTPPAEVIQKAGPGLHTFANGQVWLIQADGKATRMK